MQRGRRATETLVGLFVILALLAIIGLAFKVSGLTTLFPEKTYAITAVFDDIGGLKERAPVKIAGVQIGQVSHIRLDKNTFKAIVSMEIENRFNDLSDDSTAGIYTAGLLGDNYVAITPMYSPTFLKAGSRIEITNSAMVLEKLIGQLIYKLGGQQSDKNGDNHEAKK